MLKGQHRCRAQKRSDGRARTFPGNPYDGHILHEQLEQMQSLLEDTGSTPKQVIADLGFRGVDADNPNVNHLPRQVQVTDETAA